MAKAYDAAATLAGIIGQAPEFSHIDREIFCDVIVCGGGLAGVAALRSAVEQGAKTVLFEKCKSVQGRSGAFGAIGFRDYNRFGRSNEEMCRHVTAEIIKEGGNRGDYRLVRYWTEHSGEDLDWYIQPLGDIYVLKTTTDPVPEGVSYWLQSSRDPLPKHLDPDSDYFPSYPGVWQFRPGGHLPCLQKNFESAMETGLAQAFFETPVKSLIKENGRVVGVIAQQRDGTVIRAMAKGGVILCTGDYSGDDDLMEYYAPQVKTNPRIYGSRDRDGKRANSGDGHRMGVWAGGVLEDPPHAYVAHNMGGPLGINAYLQLDSLGRRFMNEDVGGMQVENRLERLPGRFAWQIFDAGYADYAADYSIIHGTVSHFFDKREQENGRVNPTLNNMDGYTSTADVERAAERGKLLKADTLEELVEKMGLPKETALASIARYNCLAAAGDDEDFGKKPSRMFPVVKPPFYANRLTPAPLLVTVSGLMSDEFAHVLGQDGMPIPSLYAAGNVQGSRFGSEDPSMFPGTSHGMALTFGRRAGALAAEEALRR